MAAIYKEFINKKRRGLPGGPVVKNPLINTGDAGLIPGQGTEILHAGLHAQLCPILVTLWTVDCQAPLSMELSRQEYWSGLPFPPPGDLPDPSIETASPVSPALAGRFFTFEPHAVGQLSPYAATTEPACSGSLRTQLESSLCAETNKKRSSML